MSSTERCRAGASAAERAALISSGVYPGPGSSFEAPDPLRYSARPSNPQPAEAGQEEEAAGARRRSAPQQSLDEPTPAPQQKLPSRAPVRAGPVSFVRSPHMRMAAQILESYEAKLQGANVSRVSGRRAELLDHWHACLLTWLPRSLRLPLPSHRLPCVSSWRRLTRRAR